MKIIMKSIEEKTVLSGNSHNSSSSTNPKIRIVVYGQHEVGKSALTVRYLTRRYIGEYKSNADMLYRQTMSVSNGSSMDVEIVDISTTAEDSCTSPSNGDRKTFPVEEMQKADGFIIVYSITDRSSFTFALETLTTLSGYFQSQNSRSSPPPNSSPSPSPSSTKAPIIHPIVLVANKNDLEHLRVVEKFEGVSASIQFSTHFFELSVAENSPEVYQSFQTIVSTFINHQPVKRKFSVSKMLGNFRLGRTSPSQQVAVSQAAIIDTSYDLTASSKTNEQTNTSNQSTPNSCKSHSSKTNSSNSDKDATTTGNNLSSSIYQLKSKLVDFHSMKKRHNSPPICSL